MQVFWCFGNGNARNVIISVVDNSSSSHADNFKNKFLILGEGPTFGINGSFGSPEKTFSTKISKASTKFCLNLLYLVTCLLLEKKCLNLKAKIKMLIF